MLVWDRAVFWKAFVKFVARHPLKKLAGNEESLEQPSQVLWKILPLVVLIKGKLIKLEQPFHVFWKLVPLLVSKNGKSARLEHPNHVPLKVVPLLVLI